MRISDLLNLLFASVLYTVHCICISGNKDILWSFVNSFIFNVYWR